MIKLLSLKFENIGRFVEMQTIDFSNKEKLLQFDGKNENTGGSSGSGKSTVFHVLDFILGINELPISSLQSRLTKSGYFAEGVFDIDGKPLTISRSKKDGLIVKFGDEVIEGNSKIAEEKIDQIIGIPKKLFKKMIHKKQKEGGFFLELTAKESYQFMVDCLGLQEWENKSDKISLDIKSKESKELEILRQIENQESLIKKYEEDLDSVSKPETIDVESIDKKIEINKLAIGVCEENIKKHKDEITSLRSESEKEKKEKTPPTPNMESSEELESLKKQSAELSFLEIEEKRSICNEEIETKIKNSELIILDIARKESQVKNIAEQISELKKQKEHIELAKCPTCSQNWSGESATSKISELSISIESKIKQVLEAKELIQRLPVIKTALEGFKKQKEDNSNKINEISLKYSQLKNETQNKINNIQTDKNQKLIEWNNEKQRILNEIDQRTLSKEKSLNDLIGIASHEKSLSESALNSLSLKVAEYNSKVTAYEEMTKNTKNKLSESKKTLKEIKKELDINKKSLLIASESQRAIKTYTLQIFQDTLNFIGTYATQILNAVPAMANATLYFENCKETKTGKIKDEINCIINIDGENDINIKTLSGGERTAVDLAVDLAVIEVIESQTGKGADWIILDEPFTGLDSIGCEAAIDIIKQIGIKKRIVIVDHNEAVKQIIEQTITVRRKGLESEILNGI